MSESFGIGSVVVPPVALGTMYFGTTVAPREALACLDRGFEVGARFWDTANNYAFWAGGVGDESEATIGAWLQGRGSAVRDQVVLATKIGGRPRHVGAGLDEVCGLSRSAVHDQLVGSLRRLRTDYVDVLYAHVDDPEVPLAETLGALAELVAEGSVRSIAASNLTVDRLCEAMTTPSSVRYSALQQRFTFLQPEREADLSPHVLLSDQVAAVCDEFGLTRLGYSPLLSGAYTRPDRAWPDGYHHPRDGALTALAEVAGAHDLDAGQAVLSWMIHRPQPVIPVVGVSRPDQVTSAWRAVTTKLSPEECVRLDDARRE